MAYMIVASNFPTAYVRVASQTYVLQHIIERDNWLVQTKSLSISAGNIAAKF